MKTNFSQFLLIFFLLNFGSCAKDSEYLNDIPVTGSIYGFVKDYADGRSLSNCYVSLSPDNKSCTTDDNGSFSFQSLKSGTYNLSFSSYGYHDATRTVSVEAGKRVEASIGMRAKSSLVLSSNSLDFGYDTNVLSFSINNESDNQLSFDIQNIPDWANCDLQKGMVSSLGSVSVTVTVDRNKVDYGSYRENITISYKSRTQGTESLALLMKKEQLSMPAIQMPSTSVSNITSSGFTIGGEIVSTGGASITSYGHCWSLSDTPTVNDDKTNFGSINSACVFSSIITNLSASKTYYVRAYATNSEGTSYSNTLTVTTSVGTSPGGDPGSGTGGDTGDSSSGFAGGSGTFGNPYKVSNASQLMLIRNNSDKCFELINDIDLGGANWTPYSFMGTLDGCGHKIKNLSVSKTSGNLGLFSALSKESDIQNLIIEGVKIESSGDCVGTLAGLVEYGSNIIIENVKVILTNDSYITGNNNIGGLIGSVEAYSGSYYSCTIKNCQIAYSGSGYSIRGNNSIGGLIGKLRCLTSSDYLEVSDCSVSASIKGGNYVGGIVGRSSYGMIVRSGFVGSISAQEYVGGIVGSINSDANYFSVKAKGITACTAQVNIQGKKYIGGIAGWAQDADIVSCYSTGSISGSESGGLCGYYYSSGESYLSYSTINISLGNNNNDCATIASMASGSNTEANCTNITNHLRSAGSQFANYWNFNKTWTWTGTVNGSNYNVSCPKLAWE